MLTRTLTLWLPVVITTTIFLGIADTEVSAKNRFISIGTGGPTGVYFVVGNAVCRMVHREAAEGRKKVENMVYVVRHLQQVDPIII